MNAHHQPPAETTHSCAPGLHLRASDAGLGRIVHTHSGLHLPMVTWPTDDLPFTAAVTALQTLARSGIDWTQTRDQLHRNLRQLADAVRDAGVTARQAHRNGGRR